MSKITSEKFVELVQKSQLASATALETALEAIRQENGGALPEDPVALAKALQEREVVTHWHCEKLLQGKYKGFFLGKHKLLGHLGSGGMSSVYLAEHTLMHDKRAIKVLPKSRLGNSSYLARFQLEAKAIASLNHPNIVRAHDIDNERDTHYIVMEYVDGADMQTMVKKKGPLPFTQVADFIAQAARGLQHAHEKGLIHRDVKPANLLVNLHGRIKILDLGLALFSDDKQASLTMDFNDKVLGTADYLAPEQALNSHKVDCRADIYGLGCTMYFLLTGSPPFPDGTIAQRIAKHQSAMPTDIRKLRPDCPGELDGICLKMIQKDPRFRYTSIDQVADVLEAWSAKYLVEKAKFATIGADGSASGSSLNLGDETGMGSGRKLASSVDTVSNRSGDTEAGKSNSGVSELSAGDSGILIRIANRDTDDESSRIDLEAEIRRRTAKTSGQSSGHGQAMTGRSGTQLAKGASTSKTNIAGLPHIARAKELHSASGPSHGQSESIISILPKTNSQRLLLLFGLLLMMALSVWAGFSIAVYLMPRQPTSTVVPASTPLDPPELARRN